MIRLGATPSTLLDVTVPPRVIGSWDGARMRLRCEACGCGVSAAHRPNGQVCAMLQTERAAKCRDD